MKVGLVGFPGSGKTTIFNACTGSRIDVGVGTRGGQPQLAVVKVPDARLDALGQMYQPRKLTYAEIVFMDVPSAPGSGARTIDAGTVATMREAEALVHVVRGFPLLDGTPADPLSELQDLQAEMVLADLGPVEKRLERLKREKPQPGEQELLERLRAHLEQGKPIRELAWTEQEAQRFAGYRFLTQKPLLVIVNVEESQLKKPLSSEVMAWLQLHHIAAVIMSGPVEMDIASLSKEEQMAFLQDLGLTESASRRFIQTAYTALELMSFLTAGTDECRAWTIKRGTTAHRAAGKIHSDIERGFIRAEVMPVQDLLQLGSEAKVREAGKFRLEGKEYVIKDGDVVHFRHAT